MRKTKEIIKKKDKHVYKKSQDGIIEAEWHGLQRQDKTDLTARNEKIKQGRQKWNRIDQEGAVLWQKRDQKQGAGTQKKQKEKAKKNKK